MTDSTAIIEAKNLGKSYGKKLVFSGLNFTIHPGAITGIVGANGAGKSTLLKILVGILTPSEGAIDVHCVFGYCPQNASLFEDLTINEHFQYFAAAYRMSSSAWQKSAKDLCLRYHLDRFQDYKVNQLSGGNKQKLNLILSLMQNPKLLILDEPYSGFDWETYLIFWEHARELRSNGASIVVVTHLIHDRKDIDVLFQLEGGRLTC